jgi:hypothetical protein
MSNRVCHNVCEGLALRVVDKDRSWRRGLLKRFADWDKGQKKCRFCSCVFSKESNLSYCPCCGSKLAICNLHGINKKKYAVHRY